MTIFQALVLGVLQGLAEFLPISSSAHLALAPWVFGWPAPGLAFDVSLHVGTLLAVLVYFGREWIALVRAAIDVVVTRRIDTAEKRLLLFLIAATIPGGIAGLLLDDLAETTFRAPALIATNLIVMGLVLWLVDRAARVHRPLAAMQFKDAVLIGLAQVFALAPGVSRSGATIAAGLALGLERASAARFSFLMSMPITLAAAAVKVPEAVAQSATLTPLVVGVIASGVSGFLAIAVLLRYVSRHNYGIFAVYRVLLGLTILWLVLARA
ncbi:MAG TPA: undecaprenyl-diphosphatase UppP [Gemmatimonadaceae bacterium]|nr:undecaprenyl-diphosphatase UppP [Gemmatimonadaceae bacterium]